MNAVISSYGFYTGLAIAVLSAIFAYLNKDRYKTLINDIYKPGNQELRDQLATERQKATDLATENAQYKAQVKEKDSRINDLKELNSNLPDYAALNQKTNEVMKLMSNNHTDVVNRLTDLAATITGKVKSK